MIIESRKVKDMKSVPKRDGLTARTHANIIQFTK